MKIQIPPTGIKKKINVSYLQEHNNKNHPVITLLLNRYKIPLTLNISIESIRLYNTRAKYIPVIIN